MSTSKSNEEVLIILRKLSRSSYESSPICINHFCFCIIIEIFWIPWTFNGKIYPRDIINLSLGWFPNGDMLEASMELEENDPVLSINFLFSTMALINIFHLDRALYGM